MWRALLSACLLGLTLPAWASVPSKLHVEGALLSNAGAPVADGQYIATFALYKDATGGQALWSEGPLLVTVKQGVFHTALGDKAELTASLMAQLGATAWLGIKVEPDPELPRVPLQSVAFALRASVAEAVDCSGCIAPSALDPKFVAGLAKADDLTAYAKSVDLAAYAKSADLNGYAKTADLAAYAKAADLTAYAQLSGLAAVAASGKYADLAGAPDLSVYAKQDALAAVAFTGKYGDLNGAPTLPKLGVACGTGLVVQGLKADGSLDCVTAGGALKPDDISITSNGLVTDTFTDSFASTTVPVAILDNNPTGVPDEMTLPDVGVVQKLTVTVDVTNSDISSVEVYLYDANNNEYLLYSKSGKKGDALKQSWPPATLVKGDLAGWVGKNPKGKWRIRVVDTGFLNNGKDGQVNAWSIQVGTLSSKKVAVNGGLQLQGLDAAPLTCDASQLGLMWMSKADKTLYICNGTDFFPVPLTVPGSITSPGVTCKDILTKAPMSKDGNFWIDPDGNGGLPAFQVFCDMTTSGGGWTRVDETTNYAYQGYCETACEKPYNYTLSDAQIDAIKAKSTEGRQAWQCHTVGVGVAYDLKTWPKALIDTYNGCWDPGNSAEKQNSGTETAFTNLPQRSWFAEDNGDAGEAAQHNVDHAYFR